MDAARKTLAWCLIYASLACAFRFGDRPSGDDMTLSVLTESGVVEMTMAEYLPQAIAAEMPVSFGTEALRAQAVAARTFVLAGPHHANADVCTSSACCLGRLDEATLRALWGDAYEDNFRVVTDACEDTAGQFLTWEGEPIQAVFHAGSVGWTEDSAEVWSPLPYLVRVESPETAESVPALSTEARFSPGELTDALSYVPEGEPESWLGGAERDDSGRVRWLTVGGRAFTGTELRFALGLKSANFTAQYEDGSFVFSVLGSGHGVGMSQYGAKLLAAEGWQYGDILAHYYPGTTLTQWAEV